MPRKRSSTPATYRSELGDALNVRSRRILYCASVKGSKKLGRFFALCMVLAVVALGLQRAWVHYVYESESLSLQEVELSEGSSVTLSRIIEAGDIDLNASILAIDTAQLEEKLTQLPEVISAQAYVRFPGTLQIDLVERTPVAWIECKKLGVIGRDAVRGLLLDQDATLFSCDPAVFDQMEHLPVVKLPALERKELEPGQQLSQKQGLRAFALIKQAHDLALDMPGLPAFDSVRVRSEYSLEAKFHDNSSVVFGLYDHLRQLGDLATLRLRAAETGRYLATANLIPKRNIPATLIPLE